MSTSVTKSRWIRRSDFHIVFIYFLIGLRRDLGADDSRDGGSPVHALDSSNGYERIIKLSDGRKFFTFRINVVLCTVPPISKYKISMNNSKL
jgi:hypothetical protein